MGFDWLYSGEAWLSLATLTGLEIVLGIDNIIFIAILCGKLPKDMQKPARLGGLALAMITRILLLVSIFWVMKLTKTLFTVLETEISGKDIILIIGGIFLIAKSTLEIHHSLNPKKAEEEQALSDSFTKKMKNPKLFSVIVQIAILDIVFSLDSVMTAVGMARHIEIMILAVIIAVFIMMIASGAISDFVNRHPTIKTLALAFLILIGVALIAEGLDLEIPKGYIYFAMIFAMIVEFLNICIRKHEN